MNREIKFRAWNPKEKTMVKQYAEYSNGCEAINSVTWHESSELYCADNWILMQYIGLKDKNGVEIYEGDVVRCLSSPDVDIFEVQFTHHPRSSGWEVGDDEIYEVIGSIHDNPELLSN